MMALCDRCDMKYDKDLKKTVLANTNTKYWLKCSRVSISICLLSICLCIFSLSALHDIL